MLLDVHAWYLLQRHFAFTTYQLLAGVRFVAGLESIDFQCIMFIWDWQLAQTLMEALRYLNLPHIGEVNDINLFLLEFQRSPLFMVDGLVPEYLVCHFCQKLKLVQWRSRPGSKLLQHVRVKTHVQKKVLRHDIHAKVLIVHLYYCFKVVCVTCAWHHCISY